MEYTLKRQRYWVLLSGKSKPVLSSLIAREKKPKTGEWLEVNLRPCCTVKTAIVSPGGNTKTKITVLCGTEPLADLQVSSVTPADVVTLLNDTYPGMGTFSQDGDYFYLKTTVCPSVSITLAYVA